MTSTLSLRSHLRESSSYIGDKPKAEPDLDAHDSLMASGQIETSPIRIRFTAIFSSLEGRDTVNAMAASVAETLTRQYGGCFGEYGDGYWASAASETREEYPGGRREAGCQITLTVLPDDEAGAAMAIGDAVCSAATVHGCADIRWLHLERQQVWLTPLALNDGTSFR